MNFIKMVEHVIEEVVYVDDQDVQAIKKVV